MFSLRQFCIRGRSGVVACAVVILSTFFVSTKAWGQSAFSVKSATSDSLLVVKDNGKVGIGTTNPSEKLEVNGNLKVSGSLKIPTTTRYLSIAAGTFTPWSSSGSDYQKDSELLYGIASAQVLVFFAPVQLPQGATVTGFSATVRDNDATQDITVNLESFNIYFHCLSSGASNTDVTLSPTISVPGIVDNQNYTYVVRAAWTTPANFVDIKLIKVVIAYTIDSPLP